MVGGVVRLLGHTIDRKGAGGFVFCQAGMK